MNTRLVRYSDSHCRYFTMTLLPRASPESRNESAEKRHCLMKKGMFNFGILIFYNSALLFRRSDLGLFSQHSKIIICAFRFHSSVVFIELFKEVFSVEGEEEHQHLHISPQVTSREHQHLHMSPQATSREGNHKL